MLPRLLKLPVKKSFFLFGARNTGKSTLIETQFSGTSTLMFDLLDPKQVSQFLADPSEFHRIITAASPEITHIVIDEIQKVPKLLDVVHQLMKNKSRYFIMTGSSARKLKYGGANLLAGRAFVYYLFPFSFLELGDRFDLESALQWGTLPEVFECQNDEERRQFLMSYAHTYLKEEVWGEQIIRNLEPFHRFLEVSAQSNGTVINYSNIARDVKVDAKTIKSYFDVLEDTLVGFYLEPFHLSVRKRQSGKPKFYYFDTGVSRALARMLTVPLQKRTHGYGKAFEHYLITECKRLASYFKPEFRFSYLRTPSDVEIDLIIERPGQTTLLVEIKSSEQVTRDMLSHLINLGKEIPNSELICLSNDAYVKQIENVLVFPWQQGLKEIFLDEAA